MRRVEEEYINPGHFLFGIIFGTLSSVLLTGRRGGVVAMNTSAEALPSGSVPIEMVGQTVDELSTGLSMMEGSMVDGQKVRIELVTESIPTGEDLAYFYADLLDNGHHVSQPTTKVVDGFAVTTMVAQKGSPALALLIPFIPIAIIGGLITFAIIRIEKIANALMPILVVTFTGLIVLVVILTRKPVLSAAEKIALRGKTKLLASTVPTTSRHFDKLSPKTESGNDEESVWILSSGGTVFNYRDIVPRHEFEEENKKAIDRGDMPATGEVKRGGKWERLPQTKDPRFDATQWKTYRVWFKDGSATLVDALGETQARAIIEVGKAWGKWHGTIDRIELISEPSVGPISQEISTPLFEGNGKSSEFDLFPDSPEYLAHTVDMTGWRQKLDQTFLEAVARTRRS